MDARKQPKQAAGAKHGKKKARSKAKTKPVAVKPAAKPSPKRKPIEARIKLLEEKIAKPLGLDATRAADGILRIAVTQMSHAVKAVTTERGLDAGSFTMVVYGGAGPLHASAIAREIGIRKVLIPYAPGYFSAYGMLFSDLRYDYVRSVFRKLGDVSFEDIEAAYKTMEDEGRAALAASGIQADGVVIERAADMRYVGQEHAVTVDVPLEAFENRDVAAIKAAFDAVHTLRYGYCSATEPAEIVSLRTSVTGHMPKPAATVPAAARPAPASRAASVSGSTWNVQVEWAT